MPTTHRVEHAVETLLDIPQQQDWHLRKWLLAALGLLVYLPALSAFYAYVGNIALVLALVPCIFWGILLGPYPGVVLSYVLVIPHYFLFINSGKVLSPPAYLELLIAHVVFATVSYFISNGFHLRRRLALQLTKSEQAQARFRGLFDRTSDMVFILGLDLRILDVNDQVLVLLGYRREEIVGKYYVKFIAPEEMADLDQRLEVTMGGTHRLPVYERTFLRKDGSRLVAEMDAGLIVDPHGKPMHYQAIGRDIRTRKAAQVELYRKATQDELTGLYNRAMFFEILRRAMERSKRSGTKLAVLFADLDGFKKVNDTHGHNIGDEVLKQVAERLHEVVRTTDAISRMGGDEFAIILEYLSAPQQAELIANKIEASLSQPFEFDGFSVGIGVSIGISIYPDEELTPEELLNSSDKLMYKAKRKKYEAKLAEQTQPV